MAAIANSIPSCSGATFLFNKTATAVIIAQAFCGEDGCKERACNAERFLFPLALLVAEHVERGEGIEFSAIEFAKDLKDGDLKNHPLVMLDKKIFVNRVEHCYDATLKTVYTTTDDRVNHFKVAFKMKVTVNNLVPRTRQFELAATISKK